MQPTTIIFLILGGLGCACFIRFLWRTIRYGHRIECDYCGKFYDARNESYRCPHENIEASEK
jgi:hypothetical protein